MLYFFYLTREFGIEMNIGVSTKVCNKKLSTEILQGFDLKKRSQQVEITMNYI